MEKAALFWSGGKDSAYALYKVQKEKQFKVELLVTTMSAEFHRVSMHGVREVLLDLQAQSVQIPLLKMWVPANATNSVYEQVLLETLRQLGQDGFSTVIFGDIFLQDLRIYRELLAKDAGLQAVFPLWGMDTQTLIRQILSDGFRTVTCCISTKFLTKAFLAREIDADFLTRLPPEVDSCGENGEYHTFCFDGPVFANPIQFIIGEETYTPLEIRRDDGKSEEGFWFIDLINIED